MLKDDFKKRIENEDVCAICGEKFEKSDNIRTVFDKNFGSNVKIHQRHHVFFDDKTEGTN